MAATQCKACGAETGREVVSCPSCGRVLPREAPFLARSLSVFLLVVALFRFYPAATDASDPWPWAQWIGLIGIVWYLRRNLLRGRDWARLTLGVVSVPIGFYFLLSRKTRLFCKPDEAPRKLDRWNWAAVCLGAVLVVVGLLGLAARSVEILAGRDLPDEDLQFLGDSGLVHDGEPPLWFSSTAMVSVEEHGGFFTERRVVSYETVDGELLTASSAYSGIAEITVEVSKEDPEYTVIGIEPFHFLDSFSLVVPNSDATSEASSYQAFVYELLDRWRQADVIGRLERLSPRTATRRTDEPLTARDIAKECALATKEAESYRSKLVAEIANHEDPGASSEDKSEWRLDFQMPGRFHVSQSFIDPELGEAADEWISLGSDEYLRLLGWMRLPEPTRHETNSFLTAEKFLPILERADPTAYGRYDYDGQEFLYLEYSLDDEANKVLGVQLEERLALENVIFAGMWVDLSTSLLTKVVIRLGNSGTEESDSIGELRQVFAYYGDVEVVAPAEVDMVLEPVAP